MSRSLSVETGNAVYAVMACMSVMLLGGVYYYKSDLMPYQPDHSLAAAAGVTGSSARVYEIIYFGAEECAECEDWISGTYEKWQRSELARQVRLSLRSNDCPANGRYASICRKVTRPDQTRPVFVLVEQKTGRILAMDEGEDGFARVTEEARKWVHHWHERRSMI